MKTSRMHTQKRGFTLVELLVVIAIIGLLASIVLASLSSVQLKGRNAKRIAEVDQYLKAIEFYLNDHREYPKGSSATTRYCLGDRPSTTCWNGSYSENAALQSAFSPYIASAPGIDNGLTYSGYVYRCEYQVNGICKGFSILWMQEGTNQSCGPGKAVNATYGGAWTYCEYIQCSLDRSIQTNGSYLLYCLP